MPIYLAKFIRCNICMNIKLLRLRKERNTAYLELLNYAKSYLTSLSDRFCDKSTKKTYSMFFKKVIMQFNKAWKSTRESTSVDAVRRTPTLSKNEQEFLIRQDLSKLGLIPVFACLTLVPSLIRVTNEATRLPRGINVESTNNMIHKSTSGLLNLGSYSLTKTLGYGMTTTHS